MMDNQLDSERNRVLFGLPEKNKPIGPEENSREGGEN